MSTLCNCLALRQATRRVTQLYDTALTPLDLRSTQYSVLHELDKLGPVALNPLAASMIIDRATLGHNLRPLEARGLVEIKVGEDRRSREISLTDEGRDLLTQARLLWTSAQSVFEDEIGADAAVELRGSLRRVATAKLEFKRERQGRAAV